MCIYTAGDFVIMECLYTYIHCGILLTLALVEKAVMRTFKGTLLQKHILNVNEYFSVDIKKIFCQQHLNCDNQPISLIFSQYLVLLCNKIRFMVEGHM